MQNNGVNKSIFHFLGTRIWVPVSSVYQHEDSSGYVPDHVEKCDLFSDFQYGFRSSRSTADLLTVLSDRIASAFNRYGATLALAFDISKAFDRIWHAAFLHKLKVIVNIDEPCKCDICLVSRIL